VIVAARDPFGLGRVHYDVDGRTHAPTIRAIFDALPSLPRALDQGSIAIHLNAGETPLWTTVFRSVRQVPPGHALVFDERGTSVEPHEPAPDPTGNLGELLHDSIAGALASGKRVAVALSGGLDSALVLAIARAIGSDVPAFVLSARMHDYDERDAALRTAERLGGEVYVVETTAEDFKLSLPEAVRHAEVPLYNVHPVAKLLLARTLAREGFDLVLTGDGADHVLCRDRSADYLPIVKALTDAAGVELACPFLDPAVVAHLRALPPDPHKEVVRQLASAFPIPDPLVARPTTTRLAPPIELGDLVAAGAIERLARQIGRPPPDLERDRDRVLWTTLVLLVDAFEAWV
jgi:hypothetical protein